MTVSRRTDVRGEYTELFDHWVPGLSEVNSKAYFEDGDKIKVHVETQDDQGEDIYRESY